MLVTGISGFVGKHLTGFLLEKGYRVKGIVRKGSKYEDIKDSKVELFVEDLAGPKNLSNVLDNVDYVVHLASAKKGPWQEYYLATVKGTENLLKECGQKGVKRFVYLSSIAVYDVFNGLKQFNEDAPYLKKNLTNYIRSKIEAEKICHKFSQDIPIVILRSGIVIGKGQDIFIPRLGLRFGNKFILIDKGGNPLPLVAIENLLEAIHLSMVTHVDSGDIYNVVDDEHITQQDYLKKVKKILNSDISVINLNRFSVTALEKSLRICFKMMRKTSPISKTYLLQCASPLSYSNRKLKQKMGWTPKSRVAEVLDEALLYYNNQHNRETMNLKNILGEKYKLGKTIKTAIVGCGLISTAHIKFLKKMKEIEIVGVYDTNSENASKVANRFDIKNVFGDLDEMLDKTKPDVVHLLTPPQSHRDISLRLMKKGINVLIEKPMAVNAQEAIEILENSKRYNTKICVNHEYVYDPIMIKAREVIAKGDIGNIVFVESWCGFNLGSNLNSRYMLSGAESHWTFRLPGGLFQNLMPHPLSVLVDVIGEPEKICVSTSKTGILKAMEKDEMRVLVETNKAAGLVVVSLGVNPRYQFLNIYGTKGSIFLDFLNKVFIKQTTPSGIPKAVSRLFMNFSQANQIIKANLRSMWKVATRKFTPYDGMEILIRKFYLSLIDKAEIPVSACDGFITMKIMDDIWSKAKIDTNV